MWGFKATTAAALKPGLLITRIGAAGMGKRWRSAKNRILKDEVFAQKLRKWIMLAWTSPYVMFLSLAV